MAHQPGHRHREDDSYYSFYSEDEEGTKIDPLTTIVSISMEWPSGTYYSSPAGMASASYYSNTKKPGPRPYIPEYTPSSSYSSWSPERTSIPWTTKIKQTSFFDWEGRTSISTPSLVAITTPPYSTTSAADGTQGQRPEWNSAKEPSNRGAIYAAAVVIPIVVLSAVGFVVFCCLRKRKRQDREAKATQMKVEEMKMVNEHNNQPYMAPPCSLPQYSASPIAPPPTTPICPQPIILSGSNGAYLTGIDTSDMVSVTSGNNVRADPFADNNSLSDAPPPYRPRSLVLSSVAPSSRQNSFRLTSPPPASSQTHLIGRSPFEDLSDDDDTISELDEPTQGRSVDAMSAVSDLSYQEDTIVRTSPPP